MTLVARAGAAPGAGLPHRNKKGGWMMGDHALMGDRALAKGAHALRSGHGTATWGVP